MRILLLIASCLLCACEPKPGLVVAASNNITYYFLSYADDPLQALRDSLEGRELDQPWYRVGIPSALISPSDHRVRVSLTDNSQVDVVLRVPIEDRGGSPMTTLHVGPMPTGPEIQRASGTVEAATLVRHNPTMSSIIVSSLAIQCEYRATVTIDGVTTSINGALDLLGEFHTTVL